MNSKLGKGSKTPVTENVRDGGYPLFRFPLSFWPAAFRDGGGGTPLFRYEKSVENWPKNSVFRQKTPFSAKKFQATFRDGGGGYPPFPLSIFS